MTKQQIMDAQRAIALLALVSDGINAAANIVRDVNETEAMRLLETLDAVNTAHRNLTNNLAAMISGEWDAV